jgi:DNA polymerase III subunit alpha
MRAIKLPQPRRIRVPVAVTPSRFWNLHTHSRFSSKDAVSPVKDLVKTAWSHNQPALGLMDHGNMAGAVRLYQHCKKHGLMPFPGSEMYLKVDNTDRKARRYHIGVAAFTTEGYEALVRLSSRSYERDSGNFHHKPHVDFSDFAEWDERGLTDGLAVTTGCFFGIVQQTLVNNSYDDAKWMVSTLAQWFPNLYVEMQHHNIYDETHDDDEIVDALASIARELGLPAVITQDAHYCVPKEKPVHETLKTLVSWSDDPSEARFPGDSFHLADEEFVHSHYTNRVWEQGMEGLDELLFRHNLTIPQLERYHYNVPIVTAGDPLNALVERVTLAFHAKGLDKGRGSKRYFDRLNEELEVVEATGMAGYLMLNTRICDWMNEQAIFFEVRGSAAGSLLCWLLGISQLDPLLEGLRYERFLSKDRTKPPDIDLDVEDARRGEVIAMLGLQFNVCQIGTWAEYGLDMEKGGGSLIVAYKSTKKKEGMSPQSLAAIKKLYDLPRSDRVKLQELAEKKSFSGYGTHAGGLVITSTEREFDRLVPTMLVASSDTKVTQYDMDDVEALGLLKEDILGQRSLTMLRRCIELLGRDVFDGWGWIPLDDKDTYRAIRQGRVGGVFQLEGWTNSKGCKELKPKSLRDLVHLVALYRPATIETGMKDTYIARRAGWEEVPDRHPILMRHLKETYGVPVFQDQVISVLRDVGFTPDDLTSFLKAVKASNENIGNAAQVIRGYEVMFGELASNAGFNAKDLRFVWEAIEGFAKYGFNKAHATVYGRRAYRMAYLKTHHPLEFHTALLQVNAGTQKERDYILVTRDAQVKMLRPDINVSGETWSIDHQIGAIRKGLVSIKGVGPTAAREISSHAPFQDVDDLIARCDARSVTGGKSWKKNGSLNGVLGLLQKAGVLKSIGA